MIDAYNITGYTTLVKSSPQITYKVFKKNDNMAMVFKVFLAPASSPFSDIIIYEV